MYYPLKLDRIFGLSASTREESGGEEALGEKVLRLVRKEYQRKREGEERVEVPDEALLGVAWTVWGTCLKLGLGKGVVERAVASVLGRRRGGAWDAEEALEECLEWIMLFGEREELPGFFEVGEKKGEGKGKFELWAWGDEADYGDSSHAEYVGNFNPRKGGGTGSKGEGYTAFEEPNFRS